MPAAVMWSRGLRSQLAQMLAVADPAGAVRWADLDDDTLLAQGRASGTNIGSFLGPGGPTPDALQQRLAASGAVFLDVGTGVGAICAALCQKLPALRCVGLDIMPRVPAPSMSHGSRCR
jgi:hypothetical protein